MYLGTQAMAQSRSMPSWRDVRTRWARHKLRTTEEATGPLASPGPSGTRQLTVGIYMGLRVVAVVSGIGLVNAACTTQCMIDRYAPRLHHLQRNLRLTQPNRRRG